LKRTALVLAALVMVALLVAVGAAALAGGEVGNPGGDEVGVGPTQLLADGTMGPGLM
jgi:hypothetical protein